MQGRLQCIAPYDELSWGLIYRLWRSNDLRNLISQVKERNIDGINVTVPFKNSIIPFIEKLTLEAKETKSVNTIYLENNMDLVSSLL